MTSPITTIEQRIDIGVIWDGQAPSTTPVDDELGVRRFPVDSQGGLFTFDFVGPSDSFDQYLIERIMVDFGTSATGNVFIVNRDAPTPRAVLIGSVAGGVYLYEDATLVLAHDERIQLVSVGAPAAEMYARVTAGPLRARS